jgi:hypothetical protein
LELQWLLSAPAAGIHYRKQYAGAFFGGCAGRRFVRGSGSDFLLPAAIDPKLK